MAAKIDKSLIDAWKNADAVCFDVDSTVITTEGIDELAAFCGVGQQVAELTRQAMGEGLSFREALEKRLELIQPSTSQITEMLSKHPLVLTSGVKELVRRLHQNGVHVYLISGGLLSFITPLADDLDVPAQRIFCNVLIHDEHGDYKSFDKSKPTSESQGKPRVVKHLREKHNYRSMVMIGDGMTDLETHPFVELFIGFGGNCCRQSVEEKSPWFVYSFQQLIDLL